MTARDDAIEAALRAWHGAVVDIPAAVVDAIEPIFRADERERMTLPEWTQVVADARASAAADEQKRIGDAIDARYQDIKRERQYVHERLKAYFDGVLDGLDIGEQIARGEVQP